MESDREGLLLSFDGQYPCWTRPMLDMAGLDRRMADSLVGEGLLEFEREIYSLSAEGRGRFVEAAERYGLPLQPGDPGPNRERSALRCDLMLLLDRRHLQRWGVKEYVAPFRFAVPDLTGEDLFVLREDGLVWRYPEAPAFERMAEDFPEMGAAARRRPPPSSEAVRAWVSANIPSLREAEFDLLYKSRYDFQAYAAFPQPPADPCRLFNTDRFLFSFMPPPVGENLSAYLERVGEFHMFLTMLRRLYLPGYVDLDALDQDGVNWLLFAFAGEGEARRCLELLEPVARFLPGTATPLEIWSVSLEALRNYPGGQAETIWDILPFASHAIHRMT